LAYRRLAGIVFDAIARHQLDEIEDGRQRQPLVVDEFMADAEGFQRIERFESGLVGQESCGHFLFSQDCRSALTKALARSRPRSRVTTRLANSGAVAPGRTGSNTSPTRWRSRQTW